MDEKMKCDVLIAGGGPAGVSAWLTCHARGLNALIVTNAPERSLLWKAGQIDNYPGFSGASGSTILGSMVVGAENLGMRRVTGRVLGLMRAGGTFLASVGAEVYGAKAAILATGVAVASAYPGEREHLGAGVSYCATCDGMLYRGKTVAVIGLAADAEDEAQALRQIGCQVEYFDRKRARSFAIKGEGRVTALSADGTDYPVEGVFILRDTVATDVLMPGLETDGPHIRVDAGMCTNIPGVFAAGDCTGKPYQIARAVGQGNIAALSADDYIKHEKEHAK